MQLTALPRQIAAAGAVGALAFSALAIAPAANAGVATNGYLCVNAVAGTVPVTVATDVTLPPTAPAGFDVPADLLDVKNKVTISNADKGKFTAFGVTKVDMTDYKLTLGDVAVGAGSLAVAPSAFVDNGNGTSTADINGKNAAFTTPAAGTYVVSAPTTFKLLATLGSGQNAEFVCNSTAAPTSVGSVTIDDNESITTAKARAVEAGMPAKVKVKVVAPNEVPTGKVIAQIGSKRVARGVVNAKGRVVLEVKAKFLTQASNKVKVKYLGDDYTGTSKTKVFVKVKG
ncbi:MAG: hypothetical protein JWN68_1008 [Nocardioides sp.]|jgi:hypothetical protein|uniref:DUF6801 domain-containing protein n=1 Tax=Nocardioides sp. TaxID=35761 RepID=UPI002621D3FE|nr:DUF6801 domain-containing protein [Nocardioides sp.]MCW2833055.1 hypothetical protein [Nocardioides sp.]